MNEAKSTVTMKVSGFIVVTHKDGTEDRRPFEGKVNVPAGEDGLPLDPELKAGLTKETP